jgi:hypothetical protein
MFLGLEIIIFPMVFDDTYQIIMPMTSVWARKDDEECIHLLDFPTVLLQGLC